jgi:FdhD protein
MKAISLSETHIATGGVHSVGLFDQSGPVSIIEDIGRHNALDKAIGSLIIKGERFDLGRAFAACTGRVSSDMALKCSVAGIPIVVSRGATPGRAITIAQRTGLGIIGFLRGKRLSVYANRGRFTDWGQLNDLHPLPGTGDRVPALPRPAPLPGSLHLGF